MEVCLGLMRILADEHYLDGFEELIDKQQVSQQVIHILILTVKGNPLNCTYLFQWDEFFCNFMRHLKLE
jgi:hypothetical protein